MIMVEQVTTEYSIVCFYVFVVVVAEIHQMDVQMNKNTSQEQYTLYTEDTSVCKVQPKQMPNSVSGGWSKKEDGQQHTNGDDFSATESDLNMKNVAKELIEKHTIEIVNLESKLKNDESNLIKEVLAKFEDKKNKAVNEQKDVLLKLLSSTDEEGKVDAMTKYAQHLEEVLATIEDDKVKAVQDAIEKLAEQHSVAKADLMK